MSSFPSEDSIIPLSNKSLRLPIVSSQFETSSGLIPSSSEIQGACHLSPCASRVIGGGTTQQKYTSNKLQEISSPKRRTPSSHDKLGSKQWANRWNWTCPSCYTQNWMNASSCKNCNTKFNSQCLNDASEEEDAFVPKIQESLKISELAETGNYTESIKRPNLPNCSPADSPAKINTTFPQGAEKYTRSNSPNNPSNANQEKWTCPVCTYDNWPRSVKCIMCECTQSGDQAMSLGTNEVNNGSLFSQTNLCVDSVMTPALANLSLGVSNNCSRNFETSRYEGNALNTNYSDTMRMRLFRGSEMDRRWLDACCGVVDGNVQLVEEYLSSGGDPTRQLSESEVALLDRPSAFDIGFTLIHLAIR